VTDFVQPCIFMVTVTDSILRAAIEFRFTDPFSHFTDQNAMF